MPQGCGMTDRKISENSENVHYVLEKAQRDILNSPKLLPEKSSRLLLD